MIPQPSTWKADALPIELLLRFGACIAKHLTIQIIDTDGTPFLLPLATAFEKGKVNSSWSHQTDSNRRPSDYKSVALPTVAMMACRRVFTGTDCFGEGLATLPSWPKGEMI